MGRLRPIRSKVRWSNRGGLNYQGTIVGYGFHPEYGDYIVADQRTGKILPDSIMWENNDLDLTKKDRSRNYDEYREETVEIQLPSGRKQSKQKKTYTTKRKKKHVIKK